MQQLDFTFCRPQQASEKTGTCRKLVQETSPTDNDELYKPKIEQLKQALKQKFDKEPAGRSRRRQLEEKIAKHLDGPMQIDMHDNRRVMISSRRRQGVLIIRLHHMFLQADDRVLRAIARFATKPDSWSRGVVNDFIETHAHLISATQLKPKKHNKYHKFHDLNAIFNELNQSYFKGRVQASISYGAAGTPRRRRRRSILLGSYNASERHITIHPALDQARVPRVYVSYVIFHEMLHQVFPTRRVNGRTIMHGPELRKAERAFAGRREALLWFRQNEDIVLRFRPGQSK